MTAKSLLLTLTLALALPAAPAAHAQETEPGRWTYGSTEFRPGVAWVLGRTPAEEDWILAVSCMDGVETLDLVPPAAPEEGAQGVLTFKVDNTTLTLPAEARETPAGTAWVAPLSPELSSALSRGFSMVVAAPEGTVQIGLTGSMKSIAAVRLACEAQQDNAPDLPPLDAEAADAALRARVQAACGEAPAQLDEGAILRRDLTSDGREDHVLDWSRVACLPEEGEQVAGAGRCADQVEGEDEGGRMCDAEFYVYPALPPDPPSDTIRHSGLEVWPDRFTPVRTRSVHFSKALHWRWGGTEFLGAIPQTP